MKYLVGRFTWGLLMALSLAACMDREFDQNDEYTNSQSIPLVADNKLLLSRIYIINESKSYLWFDLNNEVANFSKPELTLPLKEGNRDSYRRIPLRGLLYEYHDTEKELTFKNIPSQFIQIGDEQLSLVFKLSPLDDKEQVFLPNGQTAKIAKKRYMMTLIRLRFSSDNADIPIGSKHKYRGVEYDFLPFQIELTLIN